MSWRPTSRRAASCSGGCVVEPDQATHQCNDCGLEFRSDGRPVRTEEADW